MSKGISPQKRYRVLERDGFKCRYCGTAATDSHLVMDHVIPRKRGGRDYESNLTAACEECNAGKSDKLPTPELVEDVKVATFRYSLESSDMTQCDRCVNPAYFTHPVGDASLCGACHSSFEAGIRAGSA